MLLRQKCGFENQFIIREEIFEVEIGENGEEEKLVNYVVIEERHDCS